jgi:hypothetical protein
MRKRRLLETALEKSALDPDSYPSEIRSIENL